MGKKEVKISVIVPVYNTEAYLPQCIDSVLRQSFTDFELILVDDGSSDGSLRICMDAAASDSRIKVIHKKNSGVGATRQTGLEAATGQYLIFFDSDDFIAAETLELLYEAACRRNADIVEYTGVYRTDASGAVVGEDIVKVGSGTCLSGEDMACGILMRKRSCSLCNKLISSELVVESGARFFEGIDFGEDACFLCELALHNPKIAFVDRSLYYYRKNPQSITGSRITVEKFKSRMRFVERLQSLFSDNERLQLGLTHMKFFIKEEMCRSGLYSQDEFNAVYPEVMAYLRYLEVNRVRKFLAHTASRGYCRAVGRTMSGGIGRFAMRVCDYLYRRFC